MFLQVLQKITETEITSQKLLNIFFNQLNQAGKGFKILTPNQMLSRLPISLAQLKAGNLKNSKMKSGNYFILCTDQKNLHKIFTKG